MKKYNYIVSFEDAIKNGVSKEEYSRFSSKLWCLNNISNELAEANRLKVIELKLLSKSHINMEIINKEIDEERLN